MKHEWRAMIQYKLTEDEARQMVQGYGHPEVDYAPFTMLAGDQKPAVGDPRVFLGTHNMIREDAVVLCWNCEEAWTPELAKKECTGEGIFADGIQINQSPPLGNISAGLGTVGRNDPCPCGSGLKFKRCHGAN